MFRYLKTGAVPALASTGVSFEQYSATFDVYLNEALSQQLGCSFNVTAVYTTTTVFDALNAEDLDFAFVDATNYACLSSQYGVVPLASIARLESGIPTYTVGGNIYVRADDTSIQSAADLSGRKVTFASAGAAFTVLPWLLYEIIKAHGVDVFTDTAEVMLADNTDNAVYDLESGRTDAALLRADVLVHMEERGMINASSFKSLGSVSVIGSAGLTNVNLLLQ
ncbi:TPA: hypothetical protein ACH3X2_000387 [Trebouxia sp. C0005]